MAEKNSIGMWKSQELKRGHVKHATHHIRDIDFL
jgi:hypothetical protein